MCINISLIKSKICPVSLWSKLPSTGGSTAFWGHLGSSHNINEMPCPEDTWVKPPNLNDIHSTLSKKDQLSPQCPALPRPIMIVHCPLQAGVCMCEEGFTEVMSPTGQLNQCAPIPILEIPTAGDKKGDVKTSRAINPTLPATVQPGRTGRTWYLQPYGPGVPTTDTHPVFGSGQMVHWKHTRLCASLPNFKRMTRQLAERQESLLKIVLLLSRKDLSAVLFLGTNSTFVLS